jgi:hypothetical protein
VDGNDFANGALLDAEAAGFEVFVTADKNMRYQQSLTARKIAVVPGSYFEVEIPFE